MKSRTFCFELYPEDSSHLSILDFVKQYYDYAYILHDKDIYDTKDLEKFVKNNKIQPPWKVGDTKKPHFHVLINFKNPRSIDKIKEDIGVHIETANFYFYSRYLIHKDNPKKFQYSPLEIYTNMELRVMKALERDFNQRELETRILLDYIFYKQENGFCYLRDLTNYARENDLLLDLKMNINFYSRFLDDSCGFRR